MNEITFNVEGMMCEGCEKRIEKALKDIKEVKKVKACHENGEVKVESKKELDINKKKKKIGNLGFKILN